MLNSRYFDHAANAASTNTPTDVHRRKIHQINKMSTDHQTILCTFYRSCRGESTRRHNQDKFILITKEINLENLLNRIWLAFADLCVVC